MALEHDFSCRLGRSVYGYEEVTICLDGSEQACSIDHKKTAEDKDAADLALFVRNIQDGDDAEFVWKYTRGGVIEHVWTFSRRGDLLLVMTPMAYRAFFRYEEFAQSAAALLK